MVFFIVSRLLLLTLLLRGSKEDEEEGGSERYGEFCLRISDDSHWTSPEPDPQPTPDSAQTDRPIKPVHMKPLNLIMDSILPPYPTAVDDLEVFAGDYDHIPAMPLSSDEGTTFSQGFSGCRCTAENMKKPSETSKVLISSKRFPTETCDSVEYIELLDDGRKVCVTPFSLMSYFNNLMSFWSKPDADPNGETQQDKTTESPQKRSDPTVQPPLPGSSWVQGSQIINAEEPIRIPTEHHMSSVKDLILPLCMDCLNVMTMSDQRIVQSLEVKMQPSPCDINVEVNMEDGSVFCLDLINFEQQLQLQKISLPLEDDADRAAKSVTGCRCQEEAKKPPNEAALIKTANIWPPSDECSFTEFIETLKDDTKTCVAASNISAYLKALQEKRLLEAKDPGRDHGSSLVKQSHVVRLDERIELPIEHKKDLILPLCIGCLNLMTMSDQRIVQSLEVKMQPSPCDVYAEVNMEDGSVFCLDLINFEQQLQLQKISLPLEDDADRAAKSVTGCRCQEEAKKPPNEAALIKTANIWPPSDECSFTEFIETLKDDTKTCVAASNISAYLKALQEKRLLEAKDPRRDYPPPDILETEPEYVDYVVGSSDSQESEPVDPCFDCQSSVDWTSINPKDVLGLDMLPPLPGCSPIIMILLTDGNHFCATSSEPWFKDLMEKLDV